MVVDLLIYFVILMI